MLNSSQQILNSSRDSWTILKVNDLGMWILWSQKQSLNWEGGNTFNRRRCIFNLVCSWSLSLKSGH